MGAKINPVQIIQGFLFLENNCKTHLKIEHEELTDLCEENKMQ
jgi:hypothetical protein